MRSAAPLLPERIGAHPEQTARSQSLPEGGHRLKRIPKMLEDLATDDGLAPPNRWSLPVGAGDLDRLHRKAASRVAPDGEAHLGGDIGDGHREARESEGEAVIRAPASVIEHPDAGPLA